MGCDDYPLLAGQYQLGDMVAVQWNPDLADRFPDADHRGCRQSMREVNGLLKPFYPALCHGYHCPRCGAPTNMYGHHHPCEEGS